MSVVGVPHASARSGYAAHTPPGFDDIDIQPQPENRKASNPISSFSLVTKTPTKDIILLPASSVGSSGRQRES